MLSAVLEKAKSGKELNFDDLLSLVSVSSPEDQEALFAAAREVRDQRFGREVFLYGFIYLSTYCRNNCHFCSFRRESREAIRYRKEEADILEAARDLTAQGVHLLDLTMGEDPEILTSEGLRWLAELVKKVKMANSRPIMISPGVIPEMALGELARAGADWYACYQETHDQDLFEALRAGQDYQERQRARIEASRQGLLVEDGLLCGVGETPPQLAKSMMAMKASQVLDQVRAMGFVPPADSLCPPPPPGFASQREIIMIAALRLYMPDKLIPASLDVDGLAGLAARLNAGANVVTSIIPSGLGLAGVAQATLDIDNANRTVGGLSGVLESCGLKAAEQAAYQKFIEKRRAGYKP